MRRWLEIGHVWPPGKLRIILQAQLLDTQLMQIRYMIDSYNDAGKGWRYAFQNGPFQEAHVAFDKLDIWVAREFLCFILCFQINSLEESVAEIQPSNL
jgi:hypothetical protein